MSGDDDEVVTGLCRSITEIMVGAQVGKVSVESSECAKSVGRNEDAVEARGGAERGCFGRRDEMHAHDHSPLATPTAVGR